MQATNVVTAPPPAPRVKPDGAQPDGGGPTLADRQSMSRISQLILVWCGPALIVSFVIGSTWLAGFFPPLTAPSDSAETVARYYQENAVRIRIGLVFTCLAYALMGTWGVALAAQTRRKEGVFPALTYAQLTAMAAGTAQIVINCGLWATAAFRAGDVSPEITQAFNDAGFIILLGTWMPFSVWAVALGLSILLDRSDTPVFPRWAGWLSLSDALLIIAGATVWFFKEGPFGWAGAVCMYVPFVVFGAWILTFSWLARRNVKRGAVHEQELAPAS